MGVSASPQITRERNPSLPSRTASGRRRYVPGEDNNVECSKLVAPNGPSGNETARPEDGRMIEHERQLSETLVAKAERDQRIAQLADDLAQKSALHEQAMEERKRARQELREMQTKLDEQAQSALQRVSFAAEANEQSWRELTEMGAELKASKSELAAFRLQLVDTENGCDSSKAKANTYCTRTATGLDNADED